MLLCMPYVKMMDLVQTKPTIELDQNLSQELLVVLRVKGLASEITLKACPHCALKLVPPVS